MFIIQFFDLEEMERLKKILENEKAFDLLEKVEKSIELEHELEEMLGPIVYEKGEGWFEELMREVVEEFGLAFEKMMMEKLLRGLPPSEMEQ